MTRYSVYATDDNGNGYVTQLQDWDDDDGPLQIRVGAFAPSTVIEISPIRIEAEGDGEGEV